MSGVIEQHEKMEEQKALRRLLGRLIEGDVIGHPSAEGITKQVIDRGEGDLSPSQKAVFDEYVKKPFCQPDCYLCGTRIPYDEAWNIEAGETEDTCSSCRYDLNKRDNL